MAERAKARPKKAAAGGKVRSRGKVADMPKKAKKGGIGDNSGVPEETIRRAIGVLDSKLRAMDKIQEELDQARGVYRAARKQAKKDGLNLDAYDLIRKLRTMDQGQVHVDYADAGRYLRIIDSPLATQLDLFQNMAAPEPKVDANLQGQAAGKNAEPASNNPYTPGSEEFVQWAEGYATGQEMNQESLRQASTAGSA